MANRVDALRQRRTTYSCGDGRGFTLLLTGREERFAVIVDEGRGFNLKEEPTDLGKQYGDGTIRVDLGPRSYDIVVGTGVLAGAAAALPGRDRVAVVSQAVIADRYADPLLAALAAAGTMAELAVRSLGEERNACVSAAVRGASPTGTSPLRWG